MPIKISDIDRMSKAKWDHSYDLTKAANLWGDAPVPFVREAVETFKKSGGSKFIDLPCGDGRNTLLLAKALPFVIGADSSSHALQITQRVLTENRIENCVLMERDVFNTSFFAEQFDGALCWDLLGHLRHASLAIEELLKICKPGCHVIGSLFSTGDPTRGRDMYQIGEDEYIYTDKFYFKFYDEKTAIDLLKQFDVSIDFLKKVTWKESAHEGYREYPHEHESWAFVITKLGA